MPNGPMIPFSGPFTLVNGVIWPHLDGSARWYRFRLLNAANERFFTLNLVDENNVPRNDAVRLTVAPAERFDMLIDFSRFKLRNADPRLGGVEPDVLEFRVDSRARHDSFEVPAKLSSSHVRIKHGSTLPEDHDHVWVALLLNASGHPEMWDLEQVGPKTFRMAGRIFDDTTGIFVNHGKWAVWNIVHVANGGPAHPFHIHLTEFQALFRRGFTTPFDPAAERTAKPIDGFADLPLEKNEQGWKDTIIVDPGQWVSVTGQFSGGTGEFMYHCHILDHEDEGMDAAVRRAPARGGEVPRPSGRRPPPRRLTGIRPNAAWGRWVAGSLSHCPPARWGAPAGRLRSRSCP
ncbi:multicopper oxidase family protein [Amycolatopsis rubida]|nr:multicopper oxidase domain-containing protein [Amycolatopsis rubida]